MNAPPPSGPSDKTTAKAALKKEKRPYALLRVPPRTLRRQLLLGILVPVIMLVGFNTYSLYRETLESLHTAYDRTLLASAKSISEQLDVDGYDEHAHLRATVPYSALEAFEADNQSRMFYRISALDGSMVSGYSEMPTWSGQIAERPPYAALVDFYDDMFRGMPVRVAVLLQPVTSATGRTMAVIQVAETLEMRESLALQILRTTLAQQALMVLVIGLIVVLVVQRSTAPVRQLSHDIQSRPENDLSPISAPDAPRELQPLVEATNHVMLRLQHLLQHQQRFVRDASHQLRTPLAVLKIQVQSAQRGDVEPAQALREMNTTVDRATQLANQMLALAKVEQLRNQSETPISDFDAILREVALELSPLIAQRDLDFGIQTMPTSLKAHDWMLRELCRNLLHNAVRFAPKTSVLGVDLRRSATECVLTVSDEGPGISEALAARLYQPFSAGDTRKGSGLGLAICHEIVQALGGQIALINRMQAGRIAGLDAIVRIPWQHISETARAK